MSNSKLNNFFDHELKALVEDRIVFYENELKSPLPDYCRGVCSGNLEAYRSVLQKLKEYSNEQQ